MPFVQRIVEPKHLSRISLFEENGSPKISDQELQAVTNTTLCNALRQLASLALVADDIFKTLGGELRMIYKRSEEVRTRVANVEEKVARYDPKKVPVPEGDICSFAQTKEHYVSKHPLDTNLFKADTRPDALRQLYEAASKTPVIAMRQLDRWRRDGCRSSKFFVCTPVLGAKRRKIRSKVDIEIETRMPQAFTDLRRWTSDEALGDVTVGPNCTTRITSTLTDGDLTDGTLCSDDEGIDHKLPSPEEQVQVVALRFPAEVIAVDISGKSFDRMSCQRRSLTTGDMLSRTTQDGATDTAKRRTRARRARSRRRNTLAGTDQKEIESVLTNGNEAAIPSTSATNQNPINHTVPRSKSSDLLRSNSSKRDGSLDVKKSHFNTLKQWGKNKYEKIMNKSSDKSGDNSNSTSKSKITSNEAIDDFNLYETITMKRRKDFEKERKTHERNSSISSSEKSIPVSNSSNLLSAMVNTAVKLRDSSLHRRQRRTGANKDEIHSSSGNWSASSESGRASIGSEITTSTAHPKSTTSAATSLNSLNVPTHAPNSVNSRRRFNTSTSGSVTSEGTLTPDIIHDLLEDDGSVYSCDTEGYYTSFHMDSGLKTLKEEDFPSPTSPLQSTSVFSRSGSNNTVLTAENEYELFGKGSTSTTTSSAGTVCTTLRAADSQKSIALGPAVPERKSSLSKSSKSLNKSPDNSLERSFSDDKTGTIKRSPMVGSKSNEVAMVHKNGDISPDSGHNTSSSPIESVSSPNGLRSGSDFEFSENSDFEGAERIERIRVKTTINSSRIPSMCVITPQHSDDESSSNSSDKKQNYNVNFVNNNVLETDLDNINGNISTRIINTGDKMSKVTIDQRTGYATVENTTVIKNGDKQAMICVDKRTGYATLQSIDQPDGRIMASNNTKSIRAASPSGGNLIIRDEQTITKSTQIRASSPSGGTVTIKDEKISPKSVVNNVQPMIKASLMPLNNMLGKLKTNLSNFANKRDRSKSPGGANNNTLSVEEIDSGEYVTIADVRNNNDKLNENPSYVNDTVNKNLNTLLSGKIRDTEYVSLNELPTINENNNVTTNSRESSLERKRRQGARVMLDAEGKVVYSSDSLRRRKSAHTTFEPGPFIKQTNSPVSSPLLAHRTVQNIRPVTNQIEQKKLGLPNMDFSRPTSPHRGKMVIKASGNQGVEFIRTPSTVVSPGSPKSAPKQPKGAYVHVQTAGGVRPPKIVAEGALIIPPTTPAHYPPNFAAEMYNYVEKDPYYHQPNPYLRNDFFPAAEPNLEDNKGIYDGRGLYGPDRGVYNQEQRYFSTLPSKKSQFFNLEPQPERSVTPDITRGLQKSPQHRIQPFRSDQNVSFMIQPHFQLPQLGIPVGMPQIDTLKYQKVPYYGSQKPIPRSSEDVYGRSSKIDPSIEELYSKVNKSSKNQQNYEEIYSRIDDFDAPNEESFKISPIDPIRSSGGLKSSTPAQLRAQTNLDSQLNSPKKTTMSHEELYAAIHKSKKKLNIDDDALRSSPVNVLNTAKTNIETSTEFGKNDAKATEKVLKNKGLAETGYIGSRQSWSPSKGEYIDFQSDLDKLSSINLQNEPKTRQSWAYVDKNKVPKKPSISNLDFKKLLLSKSSVLSGGTKKLSAVEQLKLSKQKMEEQKNLKTDEEKNMTILDLSSSPRTLGSRRFFNNQPKSPEKNQQLAKIAAPTKIMSPRSQWRFNSPRTDVLSSTILEDSKEDEQSSASSSLDKKSGGRTPSDSKTVLNFSPESSPIISGQILTKENAPKATLSCENKDSPEKLTKYSSVSQKLQAQRAQFFASSSSGAAEDQSSSENKESMKNLPPTLETAF